MNITNQLVNYSDILKYVKVVVSSSFDENGKYHEHLKDYAFTIAVLAMFTDYKINGENDDELINEVLGIRYSAEWDAIYQVCGKQIDVFGMYVEKEIQEIKKPLAKFDDTLKVVCSLASQIGELINMIDIEKLKTIDLSNVMTLLEGYEAVKET